MRSNHFVQALLLLLTQLIKLELETYGISSYIQKNQKSLSISVIFPYSTEIFFRYISLMHNSSNNYIQIDATFFVEYLLYKLRLVRGLYLHPIKVSSPIEHTTYQTIKNYYVKTISFFLESLRLF